MLLSSNRLNGVHACSGTLAEHDVYEYALLQCIPMCFAQQLTGCIGCHLSCGSLVDAGKVRC